MELTLEKSYDHVELVEEFNKAMQNMVSTANGIVYCTRNIDGVKLSIMDLKKEQERYILAIDAKEKDLANYKKAVEYIQKKYTGQEQENLKASITGQIEELEEDILKDKHHKEVCEEMLSSAIIKLNQLEETNKELEEKKDQAVQDFKKASKELQEYTGIDLYAEFVEKKVVNKPEYEMIHLHDFKLNFASDKEAAMQEEYE